MKSKIVVAAGEGCVVNGAAFPAGSVLGTLDRGAKRNCPVTAGRIEVTEAARARGVTPGHLDARLTSGVCVVDGDGVAADAGAGAGDGPARDVPPPAEIPEGGPAKPAKSKKKKPQTV